MRQRATLVQKPGDGIDPASLKVTDKDIIGPPFAAVREDRVTFALEELPKYLQDILKQAHELHIRWSSSYPLESVAPFLSRIPPGLHVFYTPLDVATVDSYVAPALCLVESSLTQGIRQIICNLLRRAFGDMHCYNPKVVCPD